MADSDTTGIVLVTGNKIRDQGTKELAESLKTNTMLTTLDVGGKYAYGCMAVDARGVG